MGARSSVHQGTQSEHPTTCTHAQYRLLMSVAAYRFAQWNTTCSSASVRLSPRKASNLPVLPHLQLSSPGPAWPPASTTSRPGASAQPLAYPRGLDRRLGEQPGASMPSNLIARRLRVRDRMAGRFVSPAPLKLAICKDPIANVAPDTRASDDVGSGRRHQAASSTSAFGSDRACASVLWAVPRPGVRCRIRQVAARVHSSPIR